jgi:hypothetical protein
MKKYGLLYMIALLWASIYSCKGEDEVMMQPLVITLNTPEEDELLDLSQNCNCKVNFTWNINGQVDDGYMLFLSRTPDFSAANKYVVRNLSWNKTMANFDVEMANLGLDKVDAAQDVYWMVKSASDRQQITESQIRKVSVKRILDPVPDIALKEPEDYRRIDLAALEDADGKITFLWTPVAGIPSYQVVLSLQNETTVHTSASINGSSYEVTPAQVDAWLAGNPGSEVIVKWTVVPSGDIPATTHERVITFVKLPATEAVNISDRRELFVDRFLIGKLKGTTLKLHEPIDKGAVFYFDQPYDGRHSAYITVIKDNVTGKFCAYYRGMPAATMEGNAEVTCYIESPDGVGNWTRPNLGLHMLGGSTNNNVIWAEASISTNFSPFLDTRPGCPASERYKAIAGTAHSGVYGFTSSDGIHWTKRNQIFAKYEYALDSQNVGFWSESENCYLVYFRTSVGEYRSIGRATSTDFVNWTNKQQMQYTPFEEQLYTNNTHPYFRASHIYLSIGMRLVTDASALTNKELIDLNVASDYIDATTAMESTDCYFMTSRGGNTYDRTFTEAVIRPGTGKNNWVSRCNQPVLNVLQTGEEEMSVYVLRDYAQPSVHLSRYAWRLDGLASINASATTGEMITKPFTFTGKELEINYSTSAAGSIRIEVQNENGTPVTGFTLDDSDKITGDQIAKIVSWRNNKNMTTLQSPKKIRLRFVMKDADLYSIKFNN